MVSSCVAQIAIENDNYDFCREADTQEVKDNCYGLIAFQIEDEKYCKQISDQRIKDECYLGLSLIKHDLSLCDNIDSIKIGNECDLDKDRISSDLSLFIMNPPLTAGQLSISSIDNSITFEISPGESSEIFLVSSVDGGQDSVKVVFTGEQEGECIASVEQGYLDVITDSLNPEIDQENDRKAENAWSIGEKIIFKAYCNSIDEKELDWEKGDQLRAEIEVRYTLGNGIIEITGTGQFIGRSD